MENRILTDLSDLGPDHDVAGGQPVERTVVG